MDLSKATPRPWHFYEIPDSANDGLGYIRCEGDNLEIAHHGDAGRSADENRGNAALIVAAVNSYDPAKDALFAELVSVAGIGRLYVQLMADTSSGDDKEDAEADLEKIDAALAKARTHASTEGE